MALLVVLMKRSIILTVITCTLVFSSCSINKLAVNAISDVLGGSEGGNSFLRDNDPQLVADALPFTIKLYETLIVENPENEGLLLNTGSVLIMYANAFVQTPADTLPDIEYKKQEEMYGRAKKLYLRGKDYLFRALELRYPGFNRAIEEENLDTVLKEMSAEDVPYLYWSAAGWFGAISIDVFDLKLSAHIPQAGKLMNRAYELDPDFSNGMIHEFYILYYASLPPEMGGDKEKARYHFRRAVELTNGLSASPYVSLATTLSVANQDRSEFRKLLEQALSIEPDKNPDSRLLNMIMQEKAEWYLNHIDDFFI